MRSSFVALALATLVVVGATAFVTQADEPLAPASLDSPAPAVSWNANVTSFDGTLVPITIYKPAGASADSPVPIVLHSHGWGGSRIKDGTGLVGRLWNESFGVITIDARGHGDSTAVAMVHHKDYETKDTVAVIDFAATLDWVQKEPGSAIAGDIVVGGAGYSYAGAMQLNAASYDKRIDAITPDMSWTDLSYALAPEGVAKSVWLDILIYFAKNGGVSYDPRIDQWYREILLTNEVPQEALDHFAGSSARLEDIDADVLFIQGVPDVLFNLNQGARGYQALNAAGRSDVRLFTHLTGHVLPQVQPFGTTSSRLQTFQETGPCGATADVIVGWLDEKLRNGPDSGIPEISYALDDGTCLELDALPTTTHETAFPVVAAPSGAGTLLLPIAEGPLTIAGLPTLTADVDPLGITTVGFLGLVIVGADGHSRVVDDQTTPYRADPGKTLEIELAGVAAALGEGDQLFLRLDGANEWYAHNSPRTPGSTLLHNVRLTLPTVE